MLQLSQKKTMTIDQDWKAYFVNKKNKEKELEPFFYYVKVGDVVPENHQVKTGKGWVEAKGGGYIHKAKHAEKRAVHPRLALLYYVLHSNVIKEGY